MLWGGVRIVVACCVVVRLLGCVCVLTFYSSAPRLVWTASTRVSIRGLDLRRTVVIAFGWKTRLSSPSCRGKGDCVCAFFVDVTFSRSPDVRPMPRSTRPVGHTAGRDNMVVSHSSFDILHNLLVGCR